MKKYRFVLLAVAIAAALSFFQVSHVVAGGADTTPPTITFLTPADGAIVAPDANGWVAFKARADDAGRITSIYLVTPGGGATMWPRPPTAWAMIGNRWDARGEAPGTYFATCAARDRAGNRTEKTVRVTLVQP